MNKQNAVLDRLELKPKLPCSILVVSDIHLGAKSNKASRNVEHIFGDRVKEYTKHNSAILVLNGDIFEMWAGKDPNVQKSLDAHPRFTKNLQDFSKASNHQVIMVVGNHDGKLGWSTAEQQTIIQNFNAKICFSLAISLPSKNTTKQILFEHGHMLDSENSFNDPRDPNDKPFGQYIVERALPLVQETQGKMLEGLNHIAEPHKFAKFVASRLMYREVFNRLWWLVIPLAVTFILRLLIGYDVFTFTGYTTDQALKIVLYTELAVVVNVLIILLAVGIIVRGILRRAKTVPGAKAGEGHNEAAITKAKEEIYNRQTIGLITGHTHRPTIKHIDKGFYANSGCGVEMIYSSKARFKLPNTYISLNKLSWLELLLGEKEGSITLWQLSEDNNKQSTLERIVTKKSHSVKPLHSSHSHSFKY